MVNQYNKSKGRGWGSAVFIIFLYIFNHDPAGKTAMAPINPNGQQLVYPKTRIDRVKRQFNKRVAAITTDSLRIGKPNKSPKRPIGKSPSEG